MTDNQIKDLVLLAEELWTYDNMFSLKYELTLTDTVKYEFKLDFYSKFKGIIGLGFDKYGNEVVFSHNECIARMKEVLENCRQMDLPRKNQ